MSRDREEQRAYMRRYRAAKATSGLAAGVTPTSNTGTSVTAAVQAEIDSLTDQGTARPGLAAAALKLAELLDDPKAVPQYPAAAGRLRDLLSELQSAQPAVKETSLSRLRADFAARRPA